MSSRKQQYIILHHTGAEEKDAAHVRRNHLRRGWQDVGYNYIIERSGRVVPGRSLEIPGAHCRAAGMNYKSIGVAVIGNLDKHGPSPAQMKSLVGQVIRLQRQFGINRGSVLAHRDVPGASTRCPGRYFPFEDILRQLDEPVPYWRVQVGAFKAREDAESYAAKLRERGIDCFVVPPGDSTAQQHPSPHSTR